MEWIDARTVFLILHIFGVALGAGAAFTGDVLFLRSVSRKVLSQDTLHLLHATSVVVWIGLALLVLSGIGLVMQRPEIFLQSDKFWAKMTVVGVIAINGLAFHFVHRPVLNASAGRPFSSNAPIVQRRMWLMVSGGLSAVSWSYALILGAFGRMPFTYVQFISAYILLLVVAVGGAIVMRKRIIASV